LGAGDCIFVYLKANEEEVCPFPLPLFLLGLMVSFSIFWKKNEKKTIYLKNSKINGQFFLELCPRLGDPHPLFLY